MTIHPMSFDELQWRSGFQVDTWEEVCAVCDGPIPEDAIWGCDDQDLGSSERMLCNVFSLWASCTTAEERIRGMIRETADAYLEDDPAHAEVLRRMAESPMVAA
jgi:hypothetical protein